MSDDGVTDGEPMPAGSQDWWLLREELDVTTSFANQSVQHDHGRHTCRESIVTTTSADKRLAVYSVLPRSHSLFRLFCCALECFQIRAHK